MTKQEIRKMLQDAIPDMEEYEDFEGNKLKSVYLGSALLLDPCGKYHHILSPNGITNKCERFWNNLNDCAEELHGWIEGGEGDPIDTFFVMNNE